MRDGTQPEVNTTIDDFDPSTSILFLGSGFSLGATNIKGENPPNGVGLRQFFLKELNLPPDNDYDLQVLTEEFADQNPNKLADEIYNIFRISSLNSAQSKILGEPWRRIYTTNYDDAVEAYRHKQKIDPNSYDISDPIPNKLSPGAIIHLHGSIRCVTPDNVTTNLVLSEASYVNQYVVRSPWYEQFQHDIAFASALYIVGYRLADYHIAALLMENPNLVQRTLFIQGLDRDEIFLRRTRSFGRTLFLGTEGFADALESARRPDSKIDLSRLKSFRSMNPNRNQHALTQPTASEIYDLLVYGNFNPGRLARSQSETYAIERHERVQSAAEAVESNRALIIDGRIGNGKTIFLQLLALELAKRGWTCLLFRPGQPNVSKEIAALQGIDRLIIFVEQYLTAQDSLQGIFTALPEAKLIVEVRTSIFEVRYHELDVLVPKPFDRISLNYLTESERIAFTDLCEHAGLPSLERDQSKDLRDILLELFENKEIQRRIEGFLMPLFNNSSARRILTITLMTAEYQGSIDAGFLRSVIGVDPFLSLKPLEHLASEIFDISADGFRVRSSVFASFLIETFINPEEVARSVVALTLAAVERRSQRKYRVLMANMMAFSSLRRILKNSSDSMNVIVGIYEQLRSHEKIISEPLFWLQYAIAMTEISKLDAAQEYIQTAYRKARALPGFKTFQIDTQAFRIALIVATQGTVGKPISNIDDIIARLERISGMLSDESHRSYAARVLEGIPAFISVRRNDMAGSEAEAVQFWINQIVVKLSALPDVFKAEVGAESIRVRLVGSATLLLRN